MYFFADDYPFYKCLNKILPPDNSDLFNRLPHSWFHILLEIKLKDLPPDMFRGLVVFWETVLPVEQ